MSTIAYRVPETLGGGVAKATDSQSGGKLVVTLELGTVALASTVEVGSPPGVVVRI